MYKNHVFWKLKPKAFGRGKAENVLLEQQKIKGLKESIPEIEFMDVGINIGGMELIYMMLGCIKHSKPWKNF